MRLPPHEATWFCKICCKSLDPIVHTSPQSADTLSEPYADNSFFLGQRPFSFFHRGLVGGGVHFVRVFLKYLKKMKCTHCLLRSSSFSAEPRHQLCQEKTPSSIFLHSTVYVLYIFRTLFFFRLYSIQSKKITLNICLLWAKLLDCFLVSFHI
jgi:hypothetical protein